MVLNHITRVRPVLRSFSEVGFPYALPSHIAIYFYCFIIKQASEIKNEIFKFPSERR